MLKAANLRLSDALWNAWCVVSLLGIWPRFIEPNLLLVSKLKLKLPSLPRGLQGLRLLQFSDLHFQSSLSDAFLKRLAAKISSLKPDIIVFTGDFLCQGVLEDEQRLLSFLNTLKAPHGCFAVLGNHDYQVKMGLNANAEYDILEDNQDALITQGFKRLFSATKNSGVVTARLAKVKAHAQLVDLIKKSPFQLLHNQCIQLAIKGERLNICGFGEYSCGNTLPDTAFVGYDESCPGILLLHNPDGVFLLQKWPGEIVLSGHTHGGQVNLPWIWKKCTLLENEGFKKGLISVFNKYLYVNRGISSVFPFRWFAPPELLLMTLV